MKVVQRLGAVATDGNDKYVGRLSIRGERLTATLPDPEKTSRYIKLVR